MNRRHFIQAVIRGGMLGGLLLIPGIFLTRRQVKGKGECPASFRCAGCGKLERCTLPEAVRMKETIKGADS